MIKYEDQLCPSCRIPFGFQNTPKILKNCSHNICINCLRNQKACPLDSIAIDIEKYGMKSFLTNIRILQKLQGKQNEFLTISMNQNTKQTQSFRLRFYAKQQNYSEICFKHCKKSNLYCIQQDKLICQECFNLQEHKNSNIISYQELVKRLSIFSNQIYKTYEKVKIKSDESNVKNIHNYIQQAVNKKKDYEARIIRTFVHQSIERLRYNQKRLLNQLNLLADQNIKSLKNNNLMQQIDSYKSEWVQKVHQLTQDFQNVYNYKKIKQAFCYLNQNSQERHIPQNGLKLIQKLNQFDKSVKFSVESEIRKLEIKFDKNLLNVIDEAFSVREVKCQQQEKQQSIVKQIHQIQQVSQLPQINQIQEAIEQKQQQNKNNLQKEEEALILNHSNQQNQQNQQNVDQIIQNYQPYLSTPMISDQLVQLSQDFLLDSTIQINENNINTKHQITFDDKNTIAKIMGEQNQFTPILTKDYQSFIQFEQSTVLNLNYKPLMSQRNFLIPYQSEQKTIVNNAKQNKRSLSQNKTNKSTVNILPQEERLGFTMTKHQRGILKALNGNNHQRKKKIQIPQKYIQMWQDAKNDKCQIVDLTGAQLGDSAIISLGEYISSSQKIKSLKLIRNKLTDQIMFDMLCFIRETNIISVNLSQNYFTQKCLEVIEILDLGNIKTITLSLNKIVLRKVKDKIQMFKQKGITLSI